MTISITPLGVGGLELDVRGSMNEHDAHDFVSQAESIIKEHGSVGLLVHVQDVEGWTPHSLWDELDAKHYRDVFRLAIVGKDPDQTGMADLSKPFTAADVKFYREDEIATARRWVEKVPIDVE
jgi:SpoIIAA-like